MRPEFRNLMQDATRLTRNGDLQGATAAIQAALRAPASQPAATASGPARIQPRSGDIVIDVEAREAGAAPAGPLPQAQAQARFTAGRWGWGPGAQGRDYKVYIPSHAGNQALPLVVMLHGCTQDPDDFALGTRMNTLADAHGCLVLYPAQCRRANPQGCWNWFKHNHQARGRGEPALIAGMTRDVLARHGGDPARVYVAGLSAGGAMAAILGGTYPELYAAVGVHSGLAAGAARDLPSALGAMRSGHAGAPSTATARPTIVFHGDADATVHPANGGHVLAASAAGTTPQSEQQRAAGGRRYTRHIHRNAGGEVLAEHWVVHGGAHAWSGGSPQGSYTDARGPDASAEMLRFFLEHPRS